MSRLNSLTLFILLLSTLTYSIIEWRSESIEQDTISADRQRPDFIAEKLQSKIYSDIGLLSHTINADRMEHYTNLDVSFFEAPNYTLYPTNKSMPWQISASEATLYKDNLVSLKHNVIIKATENDSLIKEIICKEIALDLTTNIISSEQAVIVKGKNFTMLGSKLIINLNTKEMTLNQHERTIYKKNSDA
jgi:lipopolysaccharide export system protein LptC